MRIQEKRNKTHQPIVALKDVRLKAYRWQSFHYRLAEKDEPLHLILVIIQPVPIKIIRCINKIDQVTAIMNTLYSKILPSPRKFNFHGSYML
ncbi:hypothetical protein D3C78_1246960 [compost metagenome]